MNYISISLFHKVIKHAIFEGLKREDLLNILPAIDSLEKLQAVPADHFFELHEKMEEKLGPGFSVRVGQEMKIEDYGVLGLSWRTCSWAGEIFERSERYFKLLSNTYVFKVEKNTNISNIILDRDAHRRGVELSNEATLSATIVVLQAMTESNISPLKVSFKHRSPADLKSYAKAFDCPILFNQTQNFISYKTIDLEKSTAKADKSINSFLIERVQEKTKGIQLSGSKMISDVEKLIKDALPSGIPSILQIANHLGMSKRTLTRRLAENGLTFRDLVKSSQLDLAKKLLKISSRNMAEIAFETGFSEQSAFNRAFKRWTNTSPIKFRNSL